MATARMAVKIPGDPAPFPRIVPLGGQNSTSSMPREAGVGAIARNHATDCRFVAAGAELIAEGEPSGNLYIVLDGWLILHRILEDGRRQILDFVLPGGVLGNYVKCGTPYSFTAEALTNAQVAVIPLSRVGDLLSRGGSCAMTLLDAANDALIGAFDNLTDIGRRTAREAVANFLLRMDRRIGRTVSANADGSIPFPLTQEHMGDTLGLTAVHVCRTLRALRADGLVEVGRGRLRIIDRDALAVEAGAFAPEFDDTRLAG